MSEHITASLGGYVLGALEPADRAEVEAHLRGCAYCRDELSPIAGLPGLLSRLSPEDLDLNGSAADEPDPALLRRTLDEVAMQRRRHRARTRLGSAAAAVALVAGGAAGGALLTRQHGGEAGPARLVAARDVSTGADVEFRLSAHSWGTGVAVRLRHVPVGTHCRLVAVDRHGNEQTIGAWQADYDGGASITAATDLPLAQLGALRILTAQNRSLVAAVLP